MGGLPLTLGGVTSKNCFVLLCQILVKQISDTTRRNRFVHIIVTRLF